MTQLAEQTNISEIDRKKVMRVLLDARKIFDGGIGVYIRNLIAGLVESKTVDLSLLVMESEIGSSRLSNQPWLSEVKLVPQNIKPYSLAEMFQLGRKISPKEYDLFHVPHYTLPYFVKVPTVVTIHDLIHIKNPERMYYPFIASPMIFSSLLRADRVLAVSKATLNDLKRFCPLKSLDKKISYIPNAIDPKFLTECSAPKEFVANRFKVRTPYFLAVFSNLKPHKGAKDLLEAFIALKKETKSDFKLILAGQGMESMPELNRILEHLDECKDVLIVGSVTSEELTNLYAGAAAVVISSIAEGFGLPVIEAHAKGVPVVARPVPALLEQLTPYDECCEDFSVDSLERAMSSFIERHNENQDVSDKIKDSLKSYDRTEIAKAVSMMYREVIKG